MPRVFFYVISTVISFFIFTVSAVAADIGTVIKITPGVSLTRDGQTQPLALKDGIRADDIINTDASGKVQIIFTDDSTLSLGNSTNFHMRDYAEGTGDANFQGHLGKGVARVITGFIVEQNPQGFKLSTPLGVAGIRGTIVSLRHMSQQSTICVENTSKQVVFNGVSLQEGFKMEITSSGHQVSRITQEDRLVLDQETQISKAPPSAPGQASGSANSRVLVETRGDVPVYQETDIRNFALQSDGGRGLQTVAVVDSGGLFPVDLAPPLPSYADYRDSLLAEIQSQNLTGLALVVGSLNSSIHTSGYTGQFSFRADLGTGAITDGRLEARWGNGVYSYNLQGGTGTANGSTATIDWDLVSTPSVEWVADSTMTLSGNHTINNGALNGTYTVPSDTQGVNLDQGSASGTSTVIP